MKPRPRPGHGEQGMILVNVLMIVAIAAGLVLLLITREELALDRATRLRESARAQAVVRGGELSAIVALRRDLETAPGQDHRREPWAALAERGAEIDGGSFDLAIADAEGRFNVNSMRSGEAGALVLFQTIAREAEIDDRDIEAIIQYVRLQGPVTDLRPLRLVGLEPRVLAKIEPLVTALPGTTTINLNAADESLLAVLFRDPLAARRLVERRARLGYLTPRDLADEKVTIPWGTSFRSTTFWVRTRATIGGTSQQEAALIRRGFDSDRKPVAIAVERWRNAAIPPEAPDYPPPR